ncbi:ATP-binding protein [Rhizobium sp. NLR22b]|uniref:ATP-binding protein n=1 Tax=Rhizobium sp. NLR22b TaxID=2731115 RepID=UPI001C8328A7|nr:ATP-binding protein [Rhizobium sp. NLR22b]MBX5242776.1 two-component sensor histidine kinase [Rhizobium sp. NLR22b]
MKNFSPTPRSRTQVAPTLTPSEEGRFLAGILAHEFNNLLVPIIGYAEMAAEALRSGSSSPVYVERIRSAGDRAKRAVELILVSDTRHDVSDGSFDASAAIKEIRSDLQICVPPYAQLQVNLPNRSVWLEGNAIYLQQAIINLCKNAGEAMTVCGTITVNLDNFEQTAPRNTTCGRLDRGEYARLSVTDTGSGIPHMFLKRIFDPLFTTKSEEGGSGLGLTLVRQVVKALNGAINVKSRQGIGTTFELFFPLCKSAPAMMSRTHSSALPTLHDLHRDNDRGKRSRR